MKTKNEATKKTMDMADLREALVSIWGYAHHFEVAFREWDGRDPDKYYTEWSYARMVAEEFLEKWEKIAEDIAPLFNRETIVEFGRKIGGDYAMLALYCREWLEKAEEMAD